MADDLFSVFDMGDDAWSVASESSSFLDDIPILGDVLNLLKTDLGKDLTNAAFGAFGGGGSGGGGGTGKAGGSGFVAQENPVLKAASAQTFADITRSATSQERSQRAQSPGTHSNAHSRAIMNRLRQNNDSLDSLYGRLHSYISKSTSRVSPKARSTG
tara:strand:- start:296 stop:769 length:474 start_codon:yes stop_codon:yes gene_type:complete